MDTIAAPTDMLGWFVAVLAALTALASASVLVCLVGAGTERVRRRHRRGNTHRGDPYQGDALQGDAHQGFPMPDPRAEAPWPATDHEAGAAPVALFDAEAIEPDLTRDVAFDLDGEPDPVTDIEPSRQGVPSFSRPGEPPHDAAVTSPPQHEPEPDGSRVRAQPVPEPAATGDLRLPAGAEAALNAISELFPDPRNVVVTHRDPTGEVRVTRVDGLADLRRGA
jgi:hypothetical protein